ncbi:MAG: hypothetical protein V8R40_03905 [Dysosmobacter sp.]
MGPSSTSDAGIRPLYEHRRTVLKKSEAYGGLRLRGGDRRDGYSPGKGCPDACHEPWRIEVDLSRDAGGGLIDGNRDHGSAVAITVPQLCIVGGDGKSASIAAASVILAKVSRDRTCLHVFDAHADTISIFAMQQGLRHQARHYDLPMLEPRDGPLGGAPADLFEHAGRPGGHRHCGRPGEPWRGGKAARFLPSRGRRCWTISPLDIAAAGACGR